MYVILRHCQSTLYPWYSRAIYYNQLIDSQFAQFNSYLHLQKSKTDTFDIVEFFEVIPNKEHVSLFESLYKQLKPIIENSDYVPSGEQDAPEEQDKVYSAYV